MSCQALDYSKSLSNNCGWTLSNSFFKSEVLSNLKVFGAFGVGFGEGDTTILSHPFGENPLETKNAIASIVTNISTKMVDLLRIL